MALKLSKVSLFFCYLVMIFSGLFFYPKWKQTKGEATLSWDASGYYMYLPAIFIYKDIKHLSFKDSILTKYQPTPELQQAFLYKPSGNYVMKYSCGQAITMLPFFLIAHTYCQLDHSYPADGFSIPYQFCITMGMLLYAFLGLFVLRKVLLYYFKDSTVALLLLCYVIGSNYLNYASIDLAMTHNVLFTIYCLILYTTIKFHTKPTYLNAIAIGLLLGLGTLIRPTEIIAIIIPIFWGIDSFKSIKDKIHFFRNNISKIISALICFILVGCIQLVYWKIVANQWFVYSYENQGFSWLHLHIYDYTFSYISGWLRYSPMLILPMIGTIYYFFKGKNTYAIVLFILCNYYIVTAWDYWDMGGRAMIQSYPVLAFPFCLLIEKISKSKWLSVPLYLSMLLFAYLNIWWTYHAHVYADNIQVTGISKAYYWKVIGRWHATDNDKKLIDNPDAYDGIPHNVTILYYNDFSNDTSHNAIAINGNTQLRINKALQKTTPIIIKHTPTIKKWIRASALFTCISKEWDMWKQAQFIIKFYNNDELVKTNYIRIYRVLNDGESKEVFIDALVPNIKWTNAEISIWNSGGDKELLIDNLKVVNFDNN